MDSNSLLAKWELMLTPGGRLERNYWVGGWLKDWGLNPPPPTTTVYRAAACLDL